MQLKELLTEERAVSPVIGVILMVAITVILAAVIGTFVLGLGDSVNTSATAGVSVDTSGATPSVTVTSMGSNTDRVACVNSSGVEQDQVTSVGGSMDCGGTALVAVGSGDTKNSTIRTL